MTKFNLVIFVLFLQTLPCLAMESYDYDSADFRKICREKIEQELRVKNPGKACQLLRTYLENTLFQKSDEFEKTLEIIVKLNMVPGYDKEILDIITSFSKSDKIIENLISFEIVYHLLVTRHIKIGDGTTASEQFVASISDLIQLERYEKCSEMLGKIYQFLVDHQYITDGQHTRDAFKKGQPKCRRVGENAKETISPLKSTKNILQENNDKDKKDKQKNKKEETKGNKDSNCTIS